MSLEQLDVPIRISTRDVGLTQVASVWFGDVRVIEFYTKTKYPETSLREAQFIVVSGLEALIKNQIDDADLWKGSPGGSHDFFS